MFLRGGPFTRKPEPTRRRTASPSVEPLLGQECKCLQLRDLKWLAAADVGAGELVVAAHHVGLRLGKAGSVALIGIAGQLRTFAAYYPRNLVLGRLAALGAGKVVAALFGGLDEKFPLFHGLRLFP